MIADVRDDPERSRFEVATPAGPAIAAYRREGDVIVFTHTKVPENEEGHGIGSRLVAGALAQVRAKGLRLRPDCPFVAAWLERHPDERDLLA